MSKKTAKVPTNNGRNNFGSSTKSYKSDQKPFSLDSEGSHPHTFIFDDEDPDDSAVYGDCYDKTPEITSGPGHAEFMNYSPTISKYSGDDYGQTLDPPMLTMEARENQMILLATRLAEKQLAEGTASAQVITHYLKLGSTKERLEKEKLERENELLKAKAEQIQQAAYTEELYANAIEAMRRYSGND